MMHHLIMMKNWTDLLLKFLLGLHRSPSSPVSSIAGDGKGSGEGPVGVNKLKTPLFQLYFVSAIHLYVIVL